MLFPNDPTSSVAQTSKSEKYARGYVDAMESSFAGPGLLRLVTGNNCEAEGCLEMAVWRLTYKGVTSHLCAEHTRQQMFDSSRKSNIQELA